MIPLTCGTQNKQINRGRKQNSGCQELEGGGSYCFIGTEFQFEKMKKSSRDR